MTVDELNELIVMFKKPVLPQNIRSSAYVKTLMLLVFFRTSGGQLQASTAGVSAWFQDIQPLLMAALGVSR